MTTSRPSSSTPTARARRTSPPATWSSTSRPIVRHAFRYAAWTACARRRRAARGRACQRARWVSTATTRRSRLTSGAPASRSEVAVSTGSSSRSWSTLMPRPTTIPAGCSSQRMPQTLRSSSAGRSTSLGHLSPASSPATSARASRTARPVGQRQPAAALRPGRARSTDRVTEVCGGRVPGAAQPASAGLLVVGHDHAPGLGEARRLEVGGAERRVDVDSRPRLTRRDQRLVQCLTVERFAHGGKARLADMAQTTDSVADPLSVGGTDVPSPDSGIDIHSTAGKLADLKRRVAEVAHAGSERAIEKQHARGKKTARERLEMLLDEGSFIEMDKYARHRSIAFGQEAEPALRRRRRHRLRHGRRADGRGVRAGLHRLRRVAGRGLRREDLQGHGLRDEGRLPGRRASTTPAARASRRAWSRSGSTARSSAATCTRPG